jgi:ABC-type glycerol-3-phosphate transport system permease component
MIAARKSATIRESGSDRIFGMVLYIFLGLVAVVVLYPLVYILSSSFSSGSAVAAGDVWLWPVHLSLVGYVGVFKYNAVWTGFVNSIIYTVGGSVLSVMMTIAFAYALSRKAMVGRRVLIIAVLVGLLFQGGLIPTFLVVKGLGLLNTRWAIILPTALNVFAIIVAKTFLQMTIPDELYQAAQIDGCGDFRFLTSIVLPLAKPIIAVLVLWAAVYDWNSYLPALIYLNSQSLYPLSIELREILVLSQVNFSSMGNLTNAEIAQRTSMETVLPYALIVISVVPILLLYPFVQKYFVSGIFLGSVKE